MWAKLSDCLRHRWSTHVYRRSFDALAGTKFDISAQGAGIESKESERSRVSTYVLKLVVVRASGGECRIRLRFERDEIVGLVLDIVHVSALSANGTLRCSLALRPNGITMFQFDLHTI